MNFSDIMKDVRISMVTVVWTILLLTLFYYCAIARIESMVVENSADYLIINTLSVIRPVIAGLSKETRESLKFPPSTPSPTEPPVNKPLFSGSYGHMRIIMLVAGVILAINLAYNLIIFSKAGLMLFVVAMITAGIIVLIEFIFTEIITPSFIFVDFNKTIRNILKVLHAKFNCSSEIASDSKCKATCPNTFRKCDLDTNPVTGILRYCRDFPGIDVCINQPNGLKDGNCTNNIKLCTA